MLDRAALDRIAPYLGPAIVGAEHCLTEGKLNPLLANQAIRRRAIAAGAIHCPETPVDRHRAVTVPASRSARRTRRVAPAAW